MMTWSAVTSFVAVLAVDLHLVRAEQLAGAHLVLHLVLLEQASRCPSAACRRSPRLRPTILAKSTFRSSNATPCVGGFGAELADELAVFEQRLGRDAAPVEARAAEVFLLDAEDALLELPRADGRGVTGGAAADDDDVVLVACGRLRGRRAAACGARLRRACGAAGAAAGVARRRGAACGCRRAAALRTRRRERLRAPPDVLLLHLLGVLRSPSRSPRAPPPTGDLLPLLHQRSTASVPDSNASIGIVALSVSTSAISSPALDLVALLLVPLDDRPLGHRVDSCGIVISAGIGVLRASVASGDGCRAAGDGYVDRGTTLVTPTS